MGRESVTVSGKTQVSDEEEEGTGDPDNADSVKATRSYFWQQHQIDSPSLCSLSLLQTKAAAAAGGQLDR